VSEDTTKPKLWPEYGCHVDLCEGEKPDDCVISYGAHGDCTFGHTPSGRPRRHPHTCKHWQKVLAS
jgi:hypothetical protein